MTRAIAFFSVLGAIFACVPACSNAPSNNASATASPTTAAALATAVPPAASTAAASVETAVPTVAVAFTDISGTFAETAIDDEASLGIFGETSGPFQPEAGIARGDFVRWLVTANNAYNKGDSQNQIRLAEANEQSFVDVPPSNKNYRYIQGVANAGIAVGVDAKHFAPDRILTREELIAIKVPVDEGGAPQSGFTPSALKDGVKMRWAVTDLDSINPRYYESFYADPYSTSENASRVWGVFKTFHPQKTVTRAEAALALQRIGKETAESALKDRTQ
jgi:hypothetical protein